ncbi:MAG TPA: AcvB/VirJ family lysyl-phosphatidylglycerol hydrolase [Steroidobacteraceae bacterium]|nr:AcvB/VirJ family lysyl-phosphatidylglycerol hydrolase [Steroidobacteraceae bacterium]
MIRTLALMAGLSLCSAGRGESVSENGLPPVINLPLIIVPAAGASSSPWFAIFVSGDGGWAALDRGVARELAKHGISVVGWNSRKYFWSARTPEGIASDLDRVIRHYTSSWHKSRVILIGYSQGADTMPFMVNRLPASLRAEVDLTALVALSDNALFEFHVASLLGSAPRGIPIAPELERWSGSPYVCIYGAEDPDAACDKLVEAHGSTVKMAGGHHFDGHYSLIAQEILTRLPKLPGAGTQGNCASIFCATSRIFGKN